MRLYGSLLPVLQDTFLSVDTMCYNSDQSSCAMRSFHDTPYLIKEIIV